MITDKMAAEAASRLSALKFYPTELAARLEVAAMLQRMVRSSDQLEWLIGTMIDRVGQWEGTRELRAIFCTRFSPKDGIEAWATTPGFTAADSEAQYLAQECLRQLPEPTEEIIKLAEMKRLT